MELNALKFFLKVEETGSMSLAAKSLNTVQSNVTARIKKLEEELGVQLFSRKKRGMDLTAQGEVLKKYARQILDLEQQAIEAVGESLEDGGTLSLGSMETAMAQRLPPILKQFNKLQPATQLNVQTGTTQEMIKAVLDHKLDCAIVGMPIDHPEIDLYPFFEERLVLAQPAHKPDVETLLVYRKGCAYRARAEEWLNRHGRIPFKVMEFGTQEGIIGCIGAGLGMTLLPEIVAENLPDDVQISPIEDDLAVVETYLICRKNTSRPKPMNTLIELIAKKAGEIAA